MMKPPNSSNATIGRRWPRAVIAVAALVALVVGVTLFFALRPPAATPSTSPTTSPTTSGVTGTTTVLADGCLGGTDPSKAILVAHDQAPLTPEGAAAFVATWARWQGQAPHDPTEFEATGQQIWAPALPANNRKMPVTEAGTTAWITTAASRYRVTDVTRSDVTVEAYFDQTVSRDGTTSNVQHVGRFTVTSIDGHWYLKAAGAGEQAPEDVIKNLQAAGLPYREGC